MLKSNWRQAWRWWSVRVSALGALLYTLLLAFPDFVLELWALLPQEVVAQLPAHVAGVVPIAFFVAAIAARVLKQRDATDGE